MCTNLSWLYFRRIPLLLKSTLLCLPSIKLSQNSRSMHLSPEGTNSHAQVAFHIHLLRCGSNHTATPRYNIKSVFFLVVGHHKSPARNTPWIHSKCSLHPILDKVMHWNEVLCETRNMPHSLPDDIARSIIFKINFVKLALIVRQLTQIFCLVKGSIPINNPLIWIAWKS